MINMKQTMLLIRLAIVLALTFFAAGSMAFASDTKSNKKLAYIVSDIRIPFWDIMGKGIRSKANTLGYELRIYSAQNSVKKELEALVSAMKEDVSGIIISPTSSIACVTLLKLAKKAGIPVVISDIGTDSGEYVSYISSNNKDGAYQLGKVLAEKMHSLGWMNSGVGIVAIPQKRLNGQLRTAGFMKAMNEAGIRGAGIKQQSDFSYEETYNFTKELIEESADLRAIFMQGSDRYQGALDAIADTGSNNKVLLVSFDAEPVFMELIPKGVIVGAAMQQPYLMGEMSVETMDRHLQGYKVEQNQQLPVLTVSTDNIADKLPIIRRNVLGIALK